ncbi:MAG: DegT/DnrJ/EryC1/StrS family aminotransferase, partial [Planctomycetota bacterium]
MGNIENVPLLDLTRFDDAFAAEIEEAFRGVFRSGRYIMGPEVDAFQSECAEYCQVKHALGVSSGSDALILALMGIDLRAGDEVICPTFTFFATAGAVWRLGAKPVFVDLDPDTYNWNTDEALAKMNDRTRALIPVHLFGQCAEMDSVLAVANERGVPVIEDAAQAIGSESKGRRAGGIGTIGCFSFFPSKNLGAFGDAGLVTTNDDELAKRLEILRVHGGFPKYYHQFVG